MLLALQTGLLRALSALRDVSGQFWVVMCVTFSLYSPGPPDDPPCGNSCGLRVSKMIPMVTPLASLYVLELAFWPWQVVLLYGSVNSWALDWTQHTLA
jgi:hypothetical protein